MYLAGFTPEEIADKLIELGRKKHSHYYADGRIKEGAVDWTSDSVLNIFDNEKRCGDVLAQKTYTFDCIEHIVRKNNRNVPQYYGVDQHPAIISRKEFYLAQKIKHSNKGGWKNGIQTIRTYMSGELKGYVKAIPGWFGFDASDYAAASLKAYGVELPEKPLYPEYVTCEVERNKENEEVEEYEHYYEVSAEEFNSEPEITEDEYNKFIEKEPEYVTRLKELQKKDCDVNSEANSASRQIRAWQFSLKEKLVLTFDKNGMSFSRSNHSILRDDEVEMLYNPVSESVIICERSEGSEAFESLKWTKTVDGKCSMVRCPAAAICSAIYKCQNWDRKNKYIVLGRKIKLKEGVAIEYSLRTPIIRVKVKEESEDSFKKQKKDRLEIAREEAKNTGSFYSENEDDIKKYATYIDGKIDNKSRAIYFTEDSVHNLSSVSIADYDEDKYKPEFIKAMREKKITPKEGWDYLDGKIKWTPYGFELFPTDTACDCPRIYKDQEQGKSIIMNLGWTTQYQFPSKQSVLEEIELLRKRTS